LKKKEESVKIGTDYEHQRAKDYLTQQHRNSNNSSIRKMIASKHSCKEPTNQPTKSIDCSLWKATKKIKQVKKPPPLRTCTTT
jgi:hypothetical protein